jgi:O-antigen/teichoic acid export membrane protein
VSSALPSIEPLNSPLPGKNGRWRLSRTASNTFYNIGTAVLSTAGRSVLFLIGPILLDPARYGVYVYYLWVSTVSVAIGTAGTVLVAQRLTCQYGTDERHSPFASYLTITTILLTSTVLAVMLLISQSTTVSWALIAVVVALTISTAWVALRQSLLQADHNFRRPFLGELISQPIRLVGLALLKIFQAIVPSLLLLIDTVVALGKFVVIMLQPASASTRSRQEDFSRQVGWRIVQSSILPITLIAVFDTILWQRGEMYFLKMYSGLAATAYYSSASQIGQIFILAPIAAVSSLMPRLAEKALDGQHDLGYAMNRILNLSLLCAIPLYCSALIIGPIIVRLWRPQYISVVGILPLIMIGCLSQFVGTPISLALYASGRERTLLLITGFSATVALVSDYMLISRFGLIGAAAACALNQTICLVATAIAGLKSLKYDVYLHSVTISILGTVAVAQIAFALTSWRTEAAVVGLLITTIVMLREPFITKVIFPLLTHKAKA